MSDRAALLFILAMTAPLRFARVAAVITPKGATQMRIRLIALTVALASAAGLTACQSTSASRSVAPTENARPYSVLSPEDCRLIRCRPSPFL
jgi:hypothetical protein